MRTHQSKNWRLMTNTSSAATIHRVDIHLVAVHQRHTDQWHATGFVDQDSEQGAIPEHRPLVDVEYDCAPIRQGGSSPPAPGQPQHGDEVRR
jgi:hypothetical protein